MKEQIFVFNNFDNFELKHIFDCGQCFRWNEEPNGSYTGVFGNNVMNILKENRRITFKGICEEGIIKTIAEYFDLDTDYNKIKERLKQTDEHMRVAIEYGNGIRILKQDFWETLISFIVSANNHIPRIKGIIERISKKYGNEIVWQNKTYYTFPTPEQLKDVSIQDFRDLGLGFRDKRLHDTVQKVLNKEINLEYIKSIEDINKLREELMKIDGVGPKVADCIMLFSLKRFEVFPVDVWVRRVMNELYIKSTDETKVNKNDIRKLAKEKYGDIAGIAQQYLFYWKRG